MLNSPCDRPVVSFYMIFKVQFRQERCDDLSRRAARLREIIEIELLLSEFLIRRLASVGAFS